MRVIQTTKHSVLVNMSPQEFAGITGQKLKTGYYYDSPESLDVETLQDKEFNLDSAIESMKNCQYAVEQKQNMKANLDKAKEYLDRVFFPLEAVVIEQPKKGKK